MNDNNQILRNHLLELLRGGDAHIHFDDLISDFPTTLINTRIDGIPYTAWQVLEHMRIAHWDILEFSRNPSHSSPPFPEGYWPDPTTEATIEMWTESAASFQADVKKMEELLQESAIDLFARIPHGDGQTLLREVLLAADHISYHLGVLTLMKRLLTAQ